MSSDDDLRTLATRAGIQTLWRDVHGKTRALAPETLRAILRALGLPDDAREAQAQLDSATQGLPPLLTLPCGNDGVAIPGATPGHLYRLRLEDGAHREGRLEQGWSGEARLPALTQPGYHRLELDAGHCTIAAAPPRCVSLDALCGRQGTRAWALAAQIHSLRRAGDMGIGDFGGVAALARAAAGWGACGIAVSPAHALFAADPGKYGPYAPSTRLFRNVLLADPAAALGVEADGTPAEESELIDWPSAARRKLARLRRLFESAADHPGFVEYRNNAGPALEQHARFEALHAAMLARDGDAWHWKQWPEEYRTPESPGVQRFARDNPGEVAFHAFCQWLADCSCAVAQRAARDAGMAVGLIADLAVGTDGGGSHAWSRQREILPGLTVGAPPDVFSPRGQDWGLTAFSPLQLRAGGFGAFLELLRAAFRHAGGVRVDHVMGLQRLWVVPPGMGPADGGYLTYPLEDMLRLLALESHRHQALVIGEDLGTVPEGFHDRLDAAGVLGMRVLWFEQQGDGSFRPPCDWSAQAVAMTTTHDLPTVVGWWQGRDIAWRETLGLFPQADMAQQEEVRRGDDRSALWRAFLESGSATADEPPPDNPAPALEAAIAHVGQAGCALAILPMEDALGMAEQPNLPGTTEGHPNWCRRLPGEAAHLLDDAAVVTRLQAFGHTRRTAG